MSLVVEASGPFFQHDPVKTFITNLRKQLQSVANDGAAAVEAGLASGSAGRAPVSALGDRVSDHVVGRVESRIGKRWVAAAVVQVSNQGMSAAESRSLMAAGSFVESRTHGVSRVARQMRAGVTQIDLTAGLE